MSAPRVTPAANSTAQSSTAQGGSVISEINGMNTTVVWFDEAGRASQTVSIPGMVSRVAALRECQIAVVGMSGSGVTVYDASGAAIRALGAQDAIDAALSGDNLYVLTAEFVQEYSASTGEKTREFAVAAGYSGRLAAGLDGQVYVKAADGLYQIDTANNGSAIKVMNLSATLMGDPSANLASWGVLADGAVAVLITSSGGMGISTMTTGRVGAVYNALGGTVTESTMAVYTKTEGTASGNMLTITAMYDSTTLRKAVSLFARQHPEITVDLRVEMADGDTSPVEDHIRSLNTDLLAGKGGDVLILDGLPLNNYITKGILKDLTSMANSLGLVPGVLQGSAASDGKVYAIPTQFSFGAIWGRSSQLSNVQSLGDLLYANLESGQAPFSARTPQEWLRLFYPAAESSLKDAKGTLHFDTPEFAAFLETLYALYSTQGEMASFNMPGRAGDGVVMRGGMNPAEMLALYNGVSAFAPSTISGTMQMSTYYSLAGAEESAVVTTPGPTGPAHTYTPVTLAGINARSSQQTMAEEFLRILFSDDVQGVDQSGGLPTVAAALDRVVSDAIERSESNDTRMRVGVPGGVTIDIVQPSREAWESLRTLCDTVNTPATVDETLMGLLVSETAGFFEGRQSAQDAAQAVEQRAWYYLNE